MEIHVFMGEWINALQNRMNNAMDGDRFFLPTPMHLHAFLILKESEFQHKNFKVEVEQNNQA